MTARTFIRPELPDRFTIIDADSPTGEWRNAIGPLRAVDARFERDNAMIFIEDGCLPLRYGVLEQRGDVLVLHDRSEVRIAPFP